jgi:signal transduction histidine kinase
MRAFTGIRGRVTLTVLAVTSCLYSLLGAVGFLQIAHSGRDAIRERVGIVVDQLEQGLRAGQPTVTITTPDGVEALALNPGNVPNLPADEVRVERTVTIRGTTVTLVGHASQARLTDSLRSLYRGLWIGIPIAAIISAVMAGLATRRALRPVASITDLAHSIGANDPNARVPVPDTDDEIEELARTVNEMLDRIAASRLAQRQFSSDAAHELRTPLMALQGELELVQRHPGEPVADVIMRLDALATRLSVRVDELVLLSTLDERRPLNEQRASLRSILETEASAIGGEFQISNTDVVATVDATLIATAVRNLLSNAQRHATSIVHASVCLESDRIWIHVDDDGSGIEPSRRDHVFGRFARLDEARTADSGGAGLGLSIVASVAGAHNGGVTVDDSPLGGARFSMWLPALVSSA